MKTVVTFLQSMYGREGEKINILVDGKPTTRRVYYRSYCGLFIIVKGYPIFEYETRYEDEYVIEQEEV